MKALSIKQPYADLIAKGEKTLEIRSWKTKYRGDVVICSTKKPLNVGYENLKNGYTICIVELIDIKIFNKSDEKEACINWFDNQCAWVFKNPRIMEKIKITGKQSLFELKLPNILK